MTTAAETLKQKARSIARSDSGSSKSFVHTRVSNDGNGGRPTIVVELEAAMALARIQCTQEEIAAVLGVALETLRNTPGFLSAYKQAADTGRKSLRRRLWKKAMAGHPALMIWLSKQYLGMHEPGQKVEVTSSGDLDVQHTHTFQIEPEQFQAAVAILAEAGALRTLPAGVLGTGKKIIDVESGSE